MILLSSAQTVTQNRRATIKSVNSICLEKTRLKLTTQLTPLQPRVRGPKAKSHSRTTPSVLHMSVKYPHRESTKETFLSSLTVHGELGSAQLSESTILLRELTEKLSFESCLLLLLLLLLLCGPAGSGSLPNHDGGLRGDTASLTKFRPWLRISAPFRSATASLSRVPPSSQRLRTLRETDSGFLPTRVRSPLRSRSPRVSRLLSDRAGGQSQAEDSARGAGAGPLHTDSSVQSFGFK
ncbi:hypothetical protein SRHO_G00172760 [Serrasalmus rhombeus]